MDKLLYVSYVLLKVFFKAYESGGGLINYPDYE